MIDRNMSLEEFLKLANLGELHHYQKRILKQIAKLEGLPKQPLWPECPKCNGSGEVKHPLLRYTCPTCDGKGEIKAARRIKK